MHTCTSIFEISTYSYFCRIRHSTNERLKLLKGGVLSTALRHIISRDPTASVLWEPDRVLDRVLHVIEGCISKHGRAHVLVPDELTYIKQQSSFSLYAKSFNTVFIFYMPIRSFCSCNELSVFRQPTPSHHLSA